MRQNNVDIERLEKLKQENKWKSKILTFCLWHSEELRDVPQDFIEEMIGSFTRVK